MCDCRNLDSVQFCTSDRWRWQRGRRRWRGRCFWPGKKKNESPKTAKTKIDTRNVKANSRQVSQCQAISFPTFIPWLFKSLFSAVHVGHLRKISMTFNTQSIFRVAKGPTKTGTTGSFFVTSLGHKIEIATCCPSWPTAEWKPQQCQQGPRVVWLCLRW